MAIDELIAIRFDDTPYQVPAGRTILVALEAAGQEFVRGVGCRGGVCGACTVLYRMGGSFEIKAALMCQELVAPGMEILPLPYFPQRKQPHTLDLLEGATPEFTVATLYPEVSRCVMCGECSRICPQELNVMGYVGMIKGGDLHNAAAESFLCIQCLACVARCPSQISQPNAALAARRFHGRHQVPRAEHLKKSLDPAASARWKKRIRQLRRMDEDQIKALYQRREREPDTAPPGTWLPEERSLL